MSAIAATTSSIVHRGPPPGPPPSPPQAKPDSDGDQDSSISAEAASSGKRTVNIVA